MSEFFIQMMHKGLSQGNEIKCINAVRVFESTVKFNAIADKLGYSEADHGTRFMVKGYLEPCQKRR